MLTGRKPGPGMEFPGLPGRCGAGGLFAGPRAPGQPPSVSAELPATAGAYVLYFMIGSPRRLAIRTLGNPLLPEGAYAYCGNARGPGGIRARVRRHLASRKRRHWHVDHLPANRCIAVAVLPGGSECRLVDGFLAAGSSVPVPGFGSSDCQRCPAHLVKLDDNACRALEAAVRTGDNAARTRADPAPRVR